MLDDDALGVPCGPAGVHDGADVLRAGRDRRLGGRLARSLKLRKAGDLESRGLVRCVARGHQALPPHGHVDGR